MAAKKSISKLLKDNNTAAPKKKTSAVEVTDHGKLADEVAAAKIAAEDAATLFQTKEAELLAVASGIYAQHAKDGTFSKSYNFKGEEDPGVQVVYSDKFSDLPGDAEEGIKEALGDEFDFDAYFEEKRVLTLSKTDDDTVKFLMEKLGEEKFLDLFAIKVTLSAKDDMDRKQFDLPEAVRAQLKQNKGAVKLIKE
jgi:hypothetical protein